MGAGPLCGHGHFADHCGGDPRRASGDRGGLCLRRVGGHAAVYAGRLSRQRPGLPAGAPVRRPGGGGVLPSGKAPVSPLPAKRAAADHLGLFHLSAARHAQGCALLLRGADQTAPAELAGDLRCGPDPLHRHLHHRRQRSGHGDYAFAALVFAATLAVSGAGLLVYHTICKVRERRTS